MKTLPERRREPRVKVLNLVHVDRRDESGALTELTVGRTLDLSRRGMRLELSRPLPLRARVRLTLALADRIVTVDGLVRYVNELDAGSCSMGIEFVELGAELGEAIDDFLGGCT